MRRAVAATPDFAEAHYNLGIGLDGHWRQRHSTASLSYFPWRSHANAERALANGVTATL